MANNVIFKVGTKALYNALEQKDTNTLYWLTDTKEIYKGDTLFVLAVLLRRPQLVYCLPRIRQNWMNS